MSSQPRLVRFVHVVGSLGAGKSTMIERIEANSAPFLCALRRVSEFAWLKEWPDDTLVLVTREEPQRWTAPDGQSLLDLYYSADRSRYAFDFQKTVLLDRLRAAHDAVFALAANEATHVLVVTDGCINTDCGVWARRCFEKGDMTNAEWKKYNEAYDRIERDWPAHLAEIASQRALDVDVAVGGTLFVDTPLDVTRAHIEKRGRECELRLPDDFLLDVIQRHDFLMASAHYAATPVVKIAVAPLDAAVPFVLNKDA